MINNAEYLNVVDCKYDPKIHGEFEGDFEKEHFKSKFKWDDFQLHAFQAIKRENNLLVVAPTSSGKTNVAKYAMIYNLIKKNKRVIYTTPIKSLSNEKYEEMREILEPYCIQPGLMTGDQKINVDSMFLIMTAEILSNALFMLNDSSKREYSGKKNQYELDKEFVSTIGCVIIDEIHFISDQSRGHVWENILIFLDPTVQIVGLSATIDGPEEFASWIGRIKKRNITLIKKYDRPVPLEFTIYDGVTLHTIMGIDNIYNTQGFQTASKKLSELDKIYAKNKTNKVTGMFNDFIKYAKNKNLFQLCFIIFSKKNCEKFAECVSVPLVDGKESCQAINALERKMGLHLKSYETMPRYLQIKKLIQKGICYHHAGIPVILKEVIEYLYKSGHIKIIFATETIAIGVNMPIRTLVLSSVDKSVGTGMRSLNAAEFKQICGRAGRRGLDKKGLIVFLFPYDKPSENHIKCELLFGPMPKIESMMTLNYHSFLKIIRSQTIDKDSYFDNSLLCIQNTKLISGINKEITSLQIKYESVQKDIIEHINEETISNDIVREISEYVKNQNKKEISVFKIKPNKQQILKQKEIDAKVRENRKLYDLFLNLTKLEIDLEKERTSVGYFESYKNNKYQMNTEFLKQMGYMTSDQKITDYGIMASGINECNAFILTEIFTGNILQSLNPKQIVCLLSILTDKTTKTNKVDLTLKNLNIDSIIVKAIQYIESRIKIYIDMEQELGLRSDDEYWDISYDYLEITKLWVSMDLQKEDHSKILQELDQIEEYEGSFIKNILKINNIVDNLISLCELTQNLDLLPVLQEIEPMILKGMVNVDSLHVMI